MIKITDHFIERVTKRAIDKNALTDNELQSILNKIQKSCNIPFGKNYIRVKKFNRMVVCDDTSRGDILIFVVKNIKDKNGRSVRIPVTALFTPLNTQGEYNINNCISL